MIAASAENRARTALIVCVIAAIVYSNAVGNAFVLDDGGVKAQQGIEF